jgi:hypothetical protein
MIQAVGASAQSIDRRYRVGGTLLCGNSNLDLHAMALMNSVTAQNRTTYKTHLFSQDLRAVVACLTILAAYNSFTIAFLPGPVPPLSVLSINPPLIDVIAEAISRDWVRLLLPFEYDPGRGGIFWNATSILFLYGAEKYFGPLAAYVLFSNLFIATAFIAARLVTRSLCFAATIAFAFAFGTQLNYAYTYGWLIVIYILLTYCAANLALAVYLVSGRRTGARWHAAFVLSLCLAALAGEWWINYATAMIAASAFGAAWASHHKDPDTRSSSLFILGATIAVLVIYLVVRMPFGGNFLKSGTEDELIFSYPYVVLMIEDVIVNFFTLLFMTLSNYFPSLISLSNSLTYLDAPTIVAEQHGYDAGHQQLVVMSHLFLWRFYAGVVATLFLGFTGVAAVQAWRTRSIPAAVITVLALMVVAGFSTHLVIKMRPYNSVPSLTYKAIISVSAWTVLLSYLTMMSRGWLKSVRSYYVVTVSVWACIFLAALTRPGMQARHLAQVGLLGMRDPLGQILQWVWGP